jgi:hypothetical protein
MSKKKYSDLQQSLDFDAQPKKPHVRLATLTSRAEPMTGYLRSDMYKDEYIELPPLQTKAEMAMLEYLDMKYRGSYVKD